MPNDLNEANRDHNTNKYIKKIKYGNYFDQDNNEAWSFEIIFDYGEHDLENFPYILRFVRWDTDLVH